MIVLAFEFCVSALAVPPLDTPAKPSCRKPIFMLHFSLTPFCCNIRKERFVLLKIPMLSFWEMWLSKRLLAILPTARFRSSSFVLSLLNNSWLIFVEFTICLVCESVISNAEDWQWWKLNEKLKPQGRAAKLYCHSWWWRCCFFCLRWPLFSFCSNLFFMWKMLKLMTTMHAFLCWFSSPLSLLPVCLN